MPLWAITGAVATVFAGMLWVQTSRLGVAQDRLELCNAAHAQTLALVEKRNLAVKDLEKQAQDAQGRAQKALEQVRRGQVASNGEINRLEAELGKKTVTGCPSGEAVVKVRSGLK